MNEKRTMTKEHSLRKNDSFLKVKTSVAKYNAANVKASISQGYLANLSSTYDQSRSR